MARLLVLLDGGDTATVPAFTLPTARTATQKRAIRAGKESEFFELAYLDDNTGDTLSWGVRDAIVMGVSQKRDLDA